ncbi:MAG: hypothetical protein IJQ84_01500 [Paludibacteraceae bacterium]|nr:hypothetical protein [Paludibacteraceae bacterium]
MKELTKTNWLRKGMIGLFIVLNTLFLYYWIVLAANYCLHYDDVHFMWKLREYSIFEYVKEMYMTRGGNFVGYGINGIIFTIANWVGDYHFWPMVFYVFGIIMTWGAFRDFPFIKNSGYKGWLGILTLYNVYVLTSIDYAVFTWLCAMQYYLFAPILCLLVKYLSKETLNWKQWVLLIGSATFIAGNAVSISTVAFVVLFTYGMWMWYRERWSVRNTWNKPQIKRLLLITAIMLICFAIMFVAPGNWARMEDEFDIEQPANLMEFIKAIVVCSGMFMYLMAFYLPYHLIAVALGAWAGSKYPINLPMSRNKAILLILLIAFTYLFVSVLPLAYLSNGFQIQRNYIQIGYFYILTFFMLGYIWFCGAKKDENSNMNIWTPVSVSVCALFLIVIMILNIRQDLPVARAYNIAHQEREAYLLDLQEKGHKETLIVAPYPSTHTPDAKYNALKLIGKKTSMPAVYYESDTDIEPNEYERHVRKLLKFDFDFVLAEPKEK